jgi:hypothetical protein
MNRIYHFVFISLILILLFASCSKEGNEDAGFLNIDGNNYVLTYGLVDEAGLGPDNSYRNYWLRFQSSMGDQPSHFIVFKLYSYSTSAIEEGTYTYNYIQTEAGLFSWVKAGYDLQYDEEGELVGGTVLLDSQVEEGSLVVTREGEILKFEFTIKFIKNNTTYLATGEFKDVQHEGYVYYSDIKK